jgi:hypothetical protein
MVWSFLRRIVPACCVVAFLAFLNPAGAIGQYTNPFFTAPTFGGSGQAITADVNGDGKPDLLFFDGTVLLGKGDGTFTSGTTWKPSVTLTANQFAIADFNGDGKQDILVAGPLNHISVLLGKGDGMFQAAVTTNIAAPATAFVVGDLNGDGKADVLAQVGPSFFSYISNGSGTFAPGVTCNAVDASVRDAFADFNGDGKADLFVFGQGVQLGNGDGTFQTLLPFPSGTLTGSAAIGDFNGNGKLDVATSGGTASAPQLQVLLGNGDGTFSAAALQSPPPNTAVANLNAGDFNGDGKADLVGTTADSAQVLVSNGDGTFALGKFYNAPSGASINLVVGDFNGDSKKDLAAFNTMLLGNGDGTLQGNESSPNMAGIGLTADFNGDGHPDLAVAGTTSLSGPFAVPVKIWLNNGSGGFTLANTYQIQLAGNGSFVLSGALDVNGDGKIDLVGWETAVGVGWRVVVLLGNGNGSFGSPTITTGAATDSPAGVSGTLGDLNGDGKPDVMVIVTGSSQENFSKAFYVLLNNGDGTFAAPTSPFVSAPVGNVVAGDFNNDGKLDVIMGTSPGIGVLLGKGDGTFQPVTFITGSSCANECISTLAGDFNGDGKLDLMVSAPNTISTAHGYQVLTGNGDGTFNILSAVPGTFIVGPANQAVDFNGDGLVDVLGNLSASPNWLWRLATATEHLALRFRS